MFLYFSQKYHHKYLAMAIGFGLWLVNPSMGLAVTPASIDQNSDVPWSSIVENPFDGKVLYDKHFTDNFAFVSSWSKQAIKVTYTEYWSEVVSYRRVWKTRRIRQGDSYVNERYSEQEPVTVKQSRSRSPKALLFASQGKIYTYTDGVVEPELAAVLANLPAETITVRAVWDNDQTTDFPIGAGTVELWKTIFKK